MDMFGARAFSCAVGRTSDGFEAWMRRGFFKSRCWDTRLRASWEGQGEGVCVQEYISEGGSENGAGCCERSFPILVEAVW